MNCEIGLHVTLSMLGKASGYQSDLGRWHCVVILVGGAVGERGLRKALWAETSLWD